MSLVVCPVINYAYLWASWQGASGLDLFESLPGTGNLFEDFLNADRPDKGRGVGIPSGKKILNGSLQILDAAKNSPAHGLLAEL